MRDKMIGVQGIGSYFPSEVIDNLSRCSQFNRSEKFLKNKIGFLKLPRISNEMPTSDMCVQAFHALSQKIELYIAEIDCIVVCTQNPDGYGLPHTSAIVQDKLGASSGIAAFDISLGCSGFVYSLNIISSFMKANGMEKGLLFTADPYSKVIDPNDYMTEFIFGDAATCTLISSNPVYHAGKTLFSTNGRKNGAISVDQNSRLLKMNGQDVFNFTMKVVPKQIKECLEINGLTGDDVDLVLLHQASKYIVNNMKKKIEIEPHKVPFTAAGTGNTVSSTIPLMLENYIDKGPGTILMSGFGVGLSWASTIIKRLI